MYFLTVVRFLVLIAFAASINTDISKFCDPSSFHCSFSNCNGEVLNFEGIKSNLNFSEIVFHNCHQPTIPMGLFSNAPRLKRFFMFKCGLRVLQKRNYFAPSQLQSLYLPNNRLTELPEEVFDQLTKVEEIRVAYNHISHMHQKAFSGLLQLRILELNNNKIHELAMGIFSMLPNLEYIDLSSNDIESIDSKVFEMNLRLKTVLLNNNNFAIFESNSLAHLPHLSVLDISYNTITAIRLQSVDTLRAQNSQLRTCVINGSVIRIRASNNQLESISITNKSSVRELDVHSNQFESLSSFHGMINLQKLDLSKNAVRYLNSTNASLMLDLPSLQYLNLAYGDVQTLTLENFLLLSKLTHLDLAYNKLEWLDATVFEPLANLEKLYFEGNRLHLFAYETFMQNHPDIKEMGVFGNDWSLIYLKKMSDVLKANGIKLIMRFNSDEASEMASLQTNSHVHHTVHAKKLDPLQTRNPAANNRNILIIVTLCLVLIILFLQLIRILKEENVFVLFNQRIHRTIQPTRLNEEESEPL